jgi:hypothetical protein
MRRVGPLRGLRTRVEPMNAGSEATLLRRLLSLSALEQLNLSGSALDGTLITQGEQTATAGQHLLTAPHPPADFSWLG